jgi:hypothetical protein
MFSHSLFDYVYDNFGFVDVEAPSLMRSQVCTFQFLLAITSAALLGSQSHGTHQHSLLSLFVRLPQSGGPGSCIYFSQEQGSPIIPMEIRFFLTVDNLGKHKQV